MVKNLKVTEQNYCTVNYYIIQSKAIVSSCTHPPPVLLCLLLKGFSVALALDVQLVVLEPKELEESDLPKLSELTFFVLLVAVLLQSATRKQAINLFTRSAPNLHLAPLPSLPSFPAPTWNAICRHQ